MGRRSRAVFILAVPRVFEHISNPAGAGAHESTSKGVIFDFAGRQVYSKLRAKPGGELQWAVCGGAPPGARLGHSIRGAGIVILEGAGLTARPPGGHAPTGAPRLRRAATGH